MRIRRLVHAAVVLAVAAGLAVAVPSGVASAVTLSNGFLLEDTPAGLAGDPLTDFAFLPDESMIATGKNGRVNWLPKTGAPKQIATIPVVTTGDMGLLGVAIAPDYATSRTIYTARSAPGSGQYGVLRLSRWTVSVDGAGNPVGLTSERTVVETSAGSSIHPMTTVIADEDGTLWVSIGDSAVFTSVDPLALRALDINDLHGKVLHIKADGTGVPTNPFYEPGNPNSTRSKVYASGFRSPFRFSLEPNTKQPILGDVGWNTFEEINLLNPGNSYGWPCWEGTQRTPSYGDLPGCSGVNGVAPLRTYPRADGSAVAGGLIYQGKNYPAEYQGRYFFGDYASRRMWTIPFESPGAVTAPLGTPFGLEIGSVVKITATPAAGDIVFADIGSGNIRRLVYAPGNNPPTAVIEASNDPATRQVTFDGEESSDPNGDELTYAWDFGDGTTGTGAVVDHTYAGTPESFTVTLTVTDPLGAAGSKTLQVYPGNNPPELALQPPDPNRTFAVGDVIEASATATDPEDGPLQVSWATEVIHCRGAGNCHSHPGTQFRDMTPFRLPFEGHPGDTRLEITATTTDSKGATDSKTFVAKPKQRRITVQSNSPAEFTIGDEQINSGLFTVGSALTIIAPEAAADKVATFDRWSDNAPRVRTQTVPDADVTLQVNYLTPIDRRYNSEAALRQVLGAPTGVEQGDAQVRWRTYQGGRLYWSQATGVHLVMGEILAKYLAAGGHQVYGLPTTDELTPSADNRGRYNLFEGGRSIYWTQATGARLVFGMIYEKWQARGNVAFNGYPATDELPTTGNYGRFNAFERGYIYWSPATGANELHGAIYDRWASLDWERSVVGYPTTDETGTPDRIGKFNHFQFGSVYWHPNIGAYEVHGMIKQKWAALGWELSPLGYPTTNETGTPDRIGKFNHFQFGSVYWHPNIGAYEVHGMIKQKWAALGWELSPLGYPTTDETGTPDRVGKFNHFQFGSVYWHPNTGANEVRGLIRDRWAALGWELSYLGYPTSDEHNWNGLRRSNFQYGYITYNPANGQIIDRRY
ncbi:glucose/arabinose dehydrogenase [Kibdelosporangium banguiense]|uniref:Glucose/arabinose dehydrogenase n=1 Tax=Kibdelosporangium banguiense TaxID=1365924 RepID=A0ABS4U0Y0_9PSEU|nr:PQQ-dependent sugar dehydrogenase [Kibdelosporangium banguiense]MBP2330313.1 glucose/arabinose dehydrogenase [Kibdelosporangium banguiense]